MTNENLVFSETLRDSNGSIQYCECSKCGDVPAMGLVSKDESIYHIYCQNCWYNKIKEVFAKLYNDLENEDWGSSPELGGEV